MWRGEEWAEARGVAGHEACAARPGGAIRWEMALGGGLVATRSTGIVCWLDRLGRIVIPKEVRDAFGIGRDAQVAFAVDGDAVVVQFPERVCVFCGTSEHVIAHRGKGICVDCVREVRALVSGG